MQVASFKIPAKPLLLLWASVAVGATSADACGAGDSLLERRAIQN